jgi:hypothetical protein
MNWGSVIDGHLAKLFPKTHGPVYGLRCFRLIAPKERTRWSHALKLEIIEELPQSSRDKRGLISLAFRMVDKYCKAHRPGYHSVAISDNKVAALPRSVWDKKSEIVFGVELVIK